MQPEKYDPNMSPPPQQPVVDQYGFIMNPTQQKKQLINFGPKDPFIRRIIFIAGGGLLLIALVLIIASLFSKSGPSNTQQLLGIAQSQQEMVRITRPNASKLYTQDMKNFGANVLTTISSQQADLIELLGKYNVNTDVKTLGMSTNLSTDGRLSEASNSNSLDTVYAEIMQNALNDYQNELQGTFKASQSAETKQLIQTLFNTSTLLLEQLNSAQN